MKTADPKVSDYIEQSAEFAQPILEHWRKLIHKTCPGVTEAIKWGIPHFGYKGDFMLVMTAATKHCSFTFLKGALMSDPRLHPVAGQKATQRFMGKITSPDEVPSDKEFVAMIKEAMVLNEKGIKIVAPKKEAATPPAIPAYFAAALKKNPAAKKIFDEKSPSFRKEYAVWLADAKTDATKEKRTKEALEWIAEGKGRFWQYKK